MRVRGSTKFRVSGLDFKGHSRSAEVTRFDREGMTSYFSNWSYFVSFSTYAAIFSENRNFFCTSHVFNARVECVAIRIL